MVAQGALTAYRLGGAHLRFRRDEVEAVKAGLGQVLKERPPRPVGTGHRGDVSRRSVRERLGEFLYFNDFYIVATLILLLLLVLTMVT